MYKELSLTQQRYLDQDSAEKPIYTEWKRKYKRAKVGINGFGRIGRMVLRASLLKGTAVVTAINDPILDTDCLVYLMRYDSTHGRFPVTVEKVSNDELLINGRSVWIFHSREPGRVPWDEASATYIVECSGQLSEVDKAKHHLAYSKCRKVLLTTTSTEVPMYVMGVNEREYDPDSKIVALGNSSVHCLALMAKVVHETFGISNGLMTSIQSYNATEKIVDAPNMKNWREGRGCKQNIIPEHTDSAAAVTSLIPDLQGKLAGVAIGVPTADVSVVDLTCLLNRSVPFATIKDAFKNAEAGKLKGLLRCVEAELVSTDVLNDEASCVFDADASMMLSDNFVKLIGWHDNEWAYSCRVVDHVQQLYLHDNPKF